MPFEIQRPSGCRWRSPRVSRLRGGAATPVAPLVRHTSNLFTPMKPIFLFRQVPSPYGKCSLTALIALAAAPLWPADVASAGQALTLDDCLRIANDRHPMLAAAAAGVTAANEAVGEARSPYWPQVDLSTGYHRWQKRAFLPSGLTIPGRSVPEIVGPLERLDGRSVLPDDALRFW